MCCCVVVTAVPKSAPQTRSFREAAKVGHQEAEVFPGSSEVGTVSVADQARTMMTTHSWRGKPKEDKRKVMDTVSAFRAEICAKMEKSHGKKFASYDECAAFMKKVCNPGKDGVMDHDPTEVTSGKGYCAQYFRADKEIKEIKKELEDPAPASAPAKKAPAKPADDEKWYFKKDGKWQGRLHMDEKLKLPAQGYYGKLVEHDDEKTATADWGKEFGPKSNHRSYAAICRDHPHSIWCRRQGLHRPHPHHSFSRTDSVSVIAVAMSIIACALGLS